MFTKKDSAEVIALKAEIAELMIDMQGLSKSGKEYSHRVKQLEKLHALLDNNKPSRVSPDTLLVVGSNVLIALLVVAYEQKNVVSTKAQNFMLKIR